MLAGRSGAAAAGRMTLKVRQAMKSRGRWETARCGGGEGKINGSDEGDGYIHRMTEDGITDSVLIGRQDDVQDPDNWQIAN